MAHIGTGVEYALHCLLWLVASPEQQPSSRDLADLQGVPVAFMAKLLPKLEKAGIVTASGGIRGGYSLARAPESITVLEVIEAIEGRKQLFDCQQIRGRCALFQERPPAWANQGVCGIHEVMLKAQEAMRNELSRSTLASLSAGVVDKGMPTTFVTDVQGWFADRQSEREAARLQGMRARTTAREE